MIAYATSDSASSEDIGPPLESGDRYAFSLAHTRTWGSKAAKTETTPSTKITRQETEVRQPGRNPKGKGEDVESGKKWEGMETMRKVRSKRIDTFQI